ncbi:unknown [Streptomyces phage mu1/6]|uniref:Rnase E n=1 Tax=Streptomyces phage mu1/6 TaxID=370623 RepID=UPI0000D4F6CD|nr:Rnase E [Streptomyces phage mu1/6]ABD94196.1 unknown [Streptomyces phage mu1/6]
MPHQRADITKARFAASDAVEMRRTGMTYQQIGDALGVNRKTAWTYVQRALAERARQTAPDRDALLGEQIVVIETVLDGLLPKAAAGDARAAEIVLRAMDRHARLFGLDAPVRIKAELTDERIARVQQLAEQIAEVSQ